MPPGAGPPARPPRRRAGTSKRLGWLGRCPGGKARASFSGLRVRDCSAMLWLVDWICVWPLFLAPLLSLSLSHYFSILAERVMIYVEPPAFCFATRGLPDFFRSARSRYGRSTLPNPFWHSWKNGHAENGAWQKPHGNGADANQHTAGAPSLAFVGEWSAFHLASRTVGLRLHFRFPAQMFGPGEVVMVMWW